jgi:hypothetical protein
MEIDLADEVCLPELSRRKKENKKKNRRKWKLHFCEVTE